MTTRGWTLLCLVTLPLCSCEKALEVVKRLGSSKESTSKAEAPKMNLPTPPIGQVVVNVEASGYEEFIHKPGALRVVAFHADWCGPCKALAPVLAKVATEYGGWVNVGRIDVDKANDLAARLGVSAIPDVRLYIDGREVDKFSGGISPDQMRRLFDQHTKDLKAPVAASAPANGSQTPPAAAPANPVVAPMSKDWLPPGMQRR